MSFVDDANASTNNKKIRFRTSSRVLFSFDNKTEDLVKNDKNGHKNDEADQPKSNEKTSSLLSFLQVELTRDYVLEHDQERFSARREKIYTFMRIPREVERFMFYGFMQCTESFLFVYTFLPMRVLLALWALFTRPFSKCFGFRSSNNNRILTPAEICDLFKAVILIIGSIFMFSVDTNMLYHLIKSQSVIKLYIFYNMLEIGDRLFSAFGQDTIDALFWTANEPRGRKREQLGVLGHLVFATVYVILHSILVLLQATTLNVAMNSNNKALLTIMLSNNFVELKGSVFKKFDKNNLFQVSCSDVRERFHLVILLFIVVLQTMKEYSWTFERLEVLLPDCIIVLVAESLVDWIKHAFITRFNELQFDVYRDYTISLAYDMAQTRQKHAFSDHSDLVARRMGFIPLPLGVVMIRIMLNAIHLNNLSCIILFILAYLCLITLKILISIIILGKACDLITQHKQEKATIQSPTSTANRTNSPLPVTIKTINNSNKDIATSPLRPIIDQQPIILSTNNNLSNSSNFLHRQNNNSNEDADDQETAETFPNDLGPSAIFANSTVNLQNVSLNDELLKIDGDDIKIESVIESNIDVTRSFPDIVNRELHEDDKIEDGVKRAESEPSLSICNQEELNEMLPK